MKLGLIRLSTFLLTLSTAGCATYTATVALQNNAEHEPDTAQPEPFDRLEADAPQRDGDFGRHVALSSDGRTLAVGAPGTRNGTGSVYVFRGDHGHWLLERELRAANGDAGDHFGAGVSIAADGSTIVVGAPDESGDKESGEPAPSNNSAPRSGAAYVFLRREGIWTQEAYLKAHSPEHDEHFGAAVAVSGDGASILVAVPCHHVGRLGVACESSPQWVGAMVLLRRYPHDHKWGFWAQSDSKRDARGTAVGPQALALSHDGTRFALTERDTNNQTLSDTAQGVPTRCTSSGRVTLYRVDPGAFYMATSATLSPPSGTNCSVFGSAVQMSGDGKTVAVLETATAETANARSRVHLFHEAGNAWTAEAPIDIAGAPGSPLGRFDTLAMADSGTTLAVGESGWHIGRGGRVQLYRRNAQGWTPPRALQRRQLEPGGAFGTTLSLNRNGDVLSVGAPHEGEHDARSGAAYVWSLLQDSAHE